MGRGTCQCLVYSVEKALLSINKRHEAAQNQISQNRQILSIWSRIRESGHSLFGQFYRDSFWNSLPVFEGRLSMTFTIAIFWDTLIVLFYLLTYLLTYLLIPLPDMMTSRIRMRFYYLKQRASVQVSNHVYKLILG